LFAALLVGGGVILAQEFTLRVDVSLVSVDVGVFDRKGEAVTTLTRGDFEVYEDGERQQIRVFEPSGTAFSALLVVDNSGSMRSVWETVVAALNRFMDVLRPQDRIAIATFDSNIVMAVEWRGVLSGRKRQIGILPDGLGTDFYGAVEWAAGYIRGEKGRKGVIVFSDGLQSGGGRGLDRRTVDYKTALQRVRQANVPFYFVGTDARNQGAPLMKELAEVSGGRAYFPDHVDDMVGIYEQIGRDLGRAYSISYASSKPPDGRFRKIEVKPIDVRLHVSQSRDGYYAR
jgi:VWFA-related protein